ncbi:hypothetical protein L9F63_012284, partial [Diploptera punctata]
ALSPWGSRRTNIWNCKGHYYSSHCQASHRSSIHLFPVFKVRIFNNRSAYSCMS